MIPSRLRRQLPIRCGPGWTASRRPSFSLGLTSPGTPDRRTDRSAPIRAGLRSFVVRGKLRVSSPLPRERLEIAGSSGVLAFSLALPRPVLGAVALHTRSGRLEPWLMVSPEARRRRLRRLRASLGSAAAPPLEGLALAGLGQRRLGCWLGTAPRLTRAKNTDRDRPPQATLRARRRATLWRRARRLSLASPSPCARCVEAVESVGRSSEEGAEDFFPDVHVGDLAGPGEVRTAELRRSERLPTRCW